MRLCLFDPQGARLVHDKRFVDMFALDEQDAGIAKAIARLRDVESALARGTTEDLTLNAVEPVRVATRTHRRALDATVLALVTKTRDL